MESISGNSKGIVNTSNTNKNSETRVLKNNFKILLGNSRKWDDDMGAVLQMQFN